MRREINRIIIVYRTMWWPKPRPTEKEFNVLVKHRVCPANSIIPGRKKSQKFVEVKFRKIIKRDLYNYDEAVKFEQRVLNAQNLDSSSASEAASSKKKRSTKPAGAGALHDPSGSDGAGGALFSKPALVAATKPDLPGKSSSKVWIILISFFFAILKFQISCMYVDIFCNLRKSLKSRN